MRQGGANRTTEDRDGRRPDGNRTERKHRGTGEQTRRDHEENQEGQEPEARREREARTESERTKNGRDEHEPRNWEQRDGAQGDKGKETG